MKWSRLFSSFRSSPEIRWVHQEEGLGCAVACLGMLLGGSYADARTLVPAFNREKGLCSSDALRVLGEYGWAWSSKYPHYSPEGRDRRVWPVRPFAPVHFCATLVGGWHAVLMLEDGTVLDPLLRPDLYGGRRLSEYRVLEIHGLWRVS